MSEAEKWPLYQDGRERFLARILGLEDDLNHSRFFIEAVDRVPIWLDNEGVKVSTYHPDSIKKVMEGIAGERGTEVELPGDWNDYKADMGAALSGINELTDDDALEEISTYGRNHKRYRGNIGKEELMEIRDDVERYFL